MDEFDVRVTPHFAKDSRALDCLVCYRIKFSEEDRSFNFSHSSFAKCGVTGLGPTKGQREGASWQKGRAFLYHLFSFIHSINVKPKARIRAKPTDCTDFTDDRSRRGIHRK